jgi:CheY-like chemotaxis protein
MHGTIDVESTPGIGSIFTLTLPTTAASATPMTEPVAVAEPAPTPAPVPAPAPAPRAEPSPVARAVPLKNAAPKTAKLRVLLAEDQPVNQKLMRAVMEQLGHDLTIANNGVEAVEAVRKDTFDIILMDIQMPELDGVLTTKVIRASDSEWRNIPIIAVTAHAMEGHRQAYLAAGMDGFVSKPFRMDTLVGEMTRVLSATPFSATQAAPIPEAKPAKPTATDEKEAALANALDDLESLLA